MTKLLLTLFATILYLSGPGAGPAAATDQGETPAIIVTILGTGTPVPSATQYGASILVEAGGQALLFDCGRGCGIRLAEARRKIFNSLDAVFLTHLHSDHVVGLPDLWLGGWTQGRGSPLDIYGPIGTKDLMAGLRAAFAFDIRMRGAVERVPATMVGLETSIVEFTDDGVIFQRGSVTVTAFRVNHGAIEPAFGFRIDHGGKSVLLSGDTGPAANLAKYGADVDVLVLDVISPMMISKIRSMRTSREAEIIIGHHLNASQAAEILAEAEPRLALYTHTVNSPKAAGSLVLASREKYAGALLVAEDLMVISIGSGIAVQRQGSGPPEIFE